jgi:hypothetical protein
MELPVHAVVQILHLCAALLGDPHLDTASAVRGCVLAPGVVWAAQDAGMDPAVVAAQGWRETRWRPWLRSPSGVHCTAWQVAGADCAAPDGGAGAGARALAYWHARTGQVDKALACYASGNRCSANRYARQVLRAAARWRQ